MRFISHIRNFSVGILQPITEVLPGGLVRELVPLYVAQFEQTALPLEEIEFAETAFRRIPGRSQQTDEVTMTPINSRLSVFDTESPAHQAEFDTIDRTLEGQSHPMLPRGETWADGTMQHLTEQKLIDRAGDDYLLFVPTPAAAPWPTFNEFTGTAEEVVEVLQAQGHYLPGALAYERQNLNRPDVVALLEETIAQMGEPVEEFVQ